MNTGLLSIHLARKATVSGGKATGFAVPRLNTVTCVDLLAESVWKSR
jgi:hypothetical protein